MDSSHGKKRMNVEDDDRLSSLQDELIHKILSFIGIKHAIQTSVLSSRWRFIWTSMPYLNFSWDDFYRLPKFSEFVTHVLSGRDTQTEVSSVKLSNFHGKDSDVIVEQIMKYAFSHNIQQLDVACLPQNNVEFPPFLFSSRSLKHLSLTKESFVSYQRRRSCSYVFNVTSTWELPVLTTLYLDGVTLCCDENTDKCIDFFSKCANLKDLTLKSCYTKGFKGLSICLPLLSNLTLEDVCGGSVNVFNIVAPQLKNLNIRGVFTQDHQYLISAPDLAFLLYEGLENLSLSTHGFLSLEKADICVSYPHDARQVLRLLQLLHNVKSLTLNLEIVELLSSSVELMSYQPSPFFNLKSLKIHAVTEFSHYSGKMSAEVKSYLLDSSTGANLIMVPREVIIAIKNTKFAQEYVSELWELLEQEKARIEAKMTKMREHIYKFNDMCWDYTSVQIKKAKEKTSDIIVKLQDIKSLLAELPASNQATIQPSFSTLCAEAAVVMNKITECIKMGCDENQRRLNMRFHELATTLQPSS
ncbi:putative leucine-rich repeat domain superfamily, F-box-like domain superfamily [Helianthus annuus]|uniref:Leucine-rich repeat domain superfamily, F-box-like domain superfamily n=1 Tax=Helianthus annuus TaxID=4232 RepID=A0A251RN00_HELAN|nr:putative F-box/LRR-repeat protein At3g18150 [Helianthus annuus]KAF5753739.1 putative leucine-rich repeat domain superfamily, F-box-like domain superfamily [Helianthus annuus]KAJ0427764.1 putative leucine-rich repeat domain superfamily, F-box-like domain superfamily [Helianthus annuus]KAJ0431624.1 putative leucine-rich repeat domain superfamily, F-box-like domain superfamily [Helianthus annuus]KAJ0446050.1 putative leucine-rich repeat domain superfamily, F-box-like domain superfamily [Heliant